MKLKALFLTVIIILALAGAGSIWVWQKGEDTTPLPIVNNEPENETPDTHTDVEVIQPRINPETGWKIFEHPDVPITFEYPPSMKYFDTPTASERSFIIFLESSNYFFRLHIPPPKGVSKVRRKFPQWISS